MINHRVGHSFNDVIGDGSGSGSPQVLSGDILHGSLRHNLAAGACCLSPRFRRRDWPTAQAVDDYITVGLGRHTEASVIG